MGSTCRCLLFGEIRSLLGSQDYLVFAWPADAAHQSATTLTPAALWRVLSATVDQACKAANMHESVTQRVHTILEIAMLAVDDEYVDKHDDTVQLVRPQSQFAIIPPVSGG